VISAEWPFPVRWIKTPNARGLSRARNVGWKVAQGDFILFPDDDCWYPPGFLSRGMHLISATKADVITGRAADEAGNDINGRYAQVPHAINHANVWISGIEWVVLFKKAALLAVDGFDEDIGVGASTPWQACEGQDVLLRILKKGLVCCFDPSFFGHHRKFEEIAPSLMQSKGRAYARGLGYVLRLHRYGYIAATTWIARPMAKLFLSAAAGDVERSRYYFNVAVGRFEGYSGRTFLSKGSGRWRELDART
jgi:glycosyltransferase involved in cell wall biosynthesis